jgi:hypothetical protein
VVRCGQYGGGADDGCGDRGDGGGERGSRWSVAEVTEVDGAEVTKVALETEETRRWAWGQRR